jgi:glyoxylase-like metal-dependent hydrolase (beta-lactamase superfamily II)
VRIAAFIVLCVLAFPVAAASQQNFDTVQVRTQKVADGVYMLIGAGGNIGLAIGDDAVFVVDDQYAPLTPKVLAAIAALTSKPVRFVVNTHWHGDHTGGNEHMGQAGALLVAQDNVRRRLSTQQVLAFFKDTVPAAPAGALPVITFSDTITFHINGDDVQAFHIANAHTDGDAFIVWRKADVVHAGDVFVTYGFPFIDLDSGGSIDGMIAGCDVLLTLGDDSVKIIPDTGRSATAPPCASTARCSRRSAIASRNKRMRAARSRRHWPHIPPASSTRNGAAGSLSPINSSSSFTAACPSESADLARFEIGLTRNRDSGSGYASHTKDNRRLYAVAYHHGCAAGRPRSGFARAGYVRDANAPARYHSRLQQQLAELAAS